MNTPANFKMYSYLGQLLSIILILCTFVIVWDFEIIDPFSLSLIRLSILIGITTYVLMNILYVFIFRKLCLSNYMGLLKIIHTITICMVFSPFISPYYHTLDVSLYATFTLAPVSLALDVICIYLLYKKYCNALINNFHVLPKTILYSVAIFDQVTQLYILLEVSFFLLFVSDFIFFVRLNTYSLKAEKKLAIMKLETQG